MYKKQQRHSFCFLFLATMVCGLLAVVPAQAQDAPQLSTKALNITPGMQIDEVQKVFGAPDTKSVRQGSTRQSWYYGGAVVFFADGVVTAWSDDGSLLERQGLSKFQTAADSESDVLYEGGWLNLWTPQEPLSRSVVLDELIQSMHR